MFNAANGLGIMQFEGNRNSKAGIVPGVENAVIYTPVFEDHFAAATAIFQKMDKAADKASELGEVLTTLDGVNQELVAADLSGELSESSASVLNSAIEHFCKRAGIPASTAFCLENFGGKMSRKQALKIGIESISNFIKTAVEKILLWLKGAITFVLDGLQELQDGADVLVERARDVQAKAKTIAHKSVDPKNAAITDLKLLAFFTDEHGPVQSDEVVKKYESYSTMMGKDFPQYLKEMVGNINEAVTDAQEGASEDDTAQKSNTLIERLKSKAFVSFTEKSSVPTHEILTKALPFGQKEIILTLNKANDKYTGIHLVLEKNKAAGQHPAAEKLEVLTYGRIMEVSKAVEKEMLFGLFKDYAGTKSALAKMEKSVINGCNKITNIQQSDDPGDAKAVGYSVNFLKELTASVISMTATIHKYDIELAKTLLEYCARSIKAHT